MICCIADMHRSGTSFVAQWLAQAGLPLAIGGSIRPDISNPAGYYEDLDFVRLHAAHLRRRQSGSHGWRCALRQFLRLTLAKRKRAQELAALRSVTHAHWGWKDPRTTLFLPGAVVTHIGGASSPPDAPLLNGMIGEHLLRSRYRYARKYWGSGAVWLLRWAYAAAGALFCLGGHLSLAGTPGAKLKVYGCLLWATPVPPAKHCPQAGATQPAQKV